MSPVQRAVDVVSRQPTAARVPEVTAVSWLAKVLTKAAPALEPTS